MFLCTYFSFVSLIQKSLLINIIFYKPLTYNDECVVDVHAAKPVSGLTNVSPCVLCLHLFDAQSVLQHPEPRPAAVDVAAIFGPHDERRGVALHRAGQLHSAAQADALPVGHSLWHPGWTLREGEKKQLSTINLISFHNTFNTLQTQTNKKQNKI